MSEGALHFTCVAIGGHGVLIAGPSGAGKSDLALRLIDRGAMLISDDYTLLRTERKALIASPPATIAGRIEVRGVGIVTMNYLPRAPVSLLIELAEVIERLPEPSTRDLAGLSIPVVALNAFDSSAPIKVELALARVSA